VPQDRTDAGQGYTLTEHGSCGGVSQDMRTIDGRFDPGPPQRRAHDVGNRRPCQCVVRSQYCSKHLGRLQPRPALMHIAQNRWRRPFPQTLIPPSLQSISENFS